MSLATLKQRIAAHLDPPRPDAEGLSTGIAPLDQLLSGGGIPRGRLTEILGERGSGKTTFVRHIVERAIREKQWVAYIDATRTLAPREWAVIGDREEMWMIRPLDPARGAWCADVLLRSGAFSLVVLDGAPPLSRQVAVRLTRLARDSNAAFVIVADEAHTATVGGALRLRVGRNRESDGRKTLHAAGSRQAHRPGASRAAAVHGPGGTRGSRPGAPDPQYAVLRSTQRASSSKCLTPLRPFSIAVEKGGPPHTVEVSCAIGVARRLCANPEVPDRRGVAAHRRRAGGSGASGATAGREARGSAAAPAHPGGLGPRRKRRCAEPAVGRDDFRVRAAGGEGN